mgnify:FL=1
MTRTLSIYFIILVVITILLLLLVSHSPRVANTPSGTVSISAAKSDVEQLQTRYVFDVVIHEEDKMVELLKRIDDLADKIMTSEDTPDLALVLHGPEIGYCAGSNYRRYMSLVDRAAELDKRGILDVKVCDSMIRSLGLENETFPDFIDRVPFGPSEVEKLVQQGYVRM